MALFELAAVSMSAFAQQFFRAFLGACLAILCGCAGDDSGDIADPNCDALLTPADFLAECGAEITLTPTGFEGIELNPCNRTATNNEALLLVTRHPDSARAMAAADVAGGRGPNLQAGLNLQASAGSKSIFTVEVKATADAAAICNPDKLPALLDVALSRIAP